MADLILSIHILYATFVVSGFILIPLGAWRKWSWIRNIYYRLTHLVAIGVVALEEIFGITCPLTEWEYILRNRSFENTSFIGDILHHILYLNLPLQFFTTAYLFLATTAILFWVLIPVKKSSDILE